MRNKMIIFTYRLLLFSLILFVIHTFVLAKFIPKVPLTFPLYAIYLFLFVTVFIVYYIILRKFINGKTQIFNIFMLLTILKMVAVIIFFIPVFINKNENSLYDVFNFFIPYFLFLTFEIFAVNEIIQKR